MLGYRLVTKQTGAAGRRVDAVMICERLYSRREYYFALMLDRKFAVSGAAAAAAAFSRQCLRCLMHSCLALI